MSQFLATEPTSAKSHQGISQPGFCPDVARGRLPDAEAVPQFMLQHVHTARECGAVFASFKAFDSPLRHQMAVGSCHFGTHWIWWQVEAQSGHEALTQLPRYVAARTTAIRVGEIHTP